MAFDSHGCNPTNSGLKGKVQVHFDQIASLEISAFIRQVFVDSNQQIWLRSGRQELFICDSFHHPVIRFIGNSRRLAVQDNRIAFESTNGNVYLLDATTKNPRLIWQASDNVHFYQICVNDSAVAFATSDGIFVLGNDGRIDTYALSVVPNAMDFVFLGREIWLADERVQAIHLSEYETTVVGERTRADYPYFSISNSPNGQVSLCGNSIEIFDANSRSIANGQLPCAGSLFIDERTLLVKFGGRQPDKPEFRCFTLNPTVSGMEEIRLVAAYCASAFAFDHKSGLAVVCYGGIMKVGRFIWST